jgi:hypothetical protein
MSSEQNTKILTTNPSPDDLIPISKWRELGLGVQRRVIGRRIASGEFPTPIRIKGRLYITYGQLEEYKSRLNLGDGKGHWAQGGERKPGREGFKNEKRANGSSPSVAMRRAEEPEQRAQRVRLISEEAAALEQRLATLRSEAEQLSSSTGA